MKDGSGTLTLTATNTYSGPTNVASGTLRAGSTTAFSAASAFTVNSVLDLNSGNLTKVGTGTLTLTETTNYTGATNVNAGVLAGGAQNALSPVPTRRLALWRGEPDRALSSGTTF